MRRWHDAGASWSCQQGETHVHASAPTGAVRGDRGWERLVPSAERRRHQQGRVRCTRTPSRPACGSSLTGGRSCTHALRRGAARLRAATHAIWDTTAALRHLRLGRPRFPVDILILSPYTPLTVMPEGLQAQDRARARRGGLLACPRIRSSRPIPTLLNRPTSGPNASTAPSPHAPPHPRGGGRSVVCGWDHIRGDRHQSTSRRAV
jgi:hypothetical protein